MTTSPDVSSTSAGWSFSISTEDASEHTALRDDPLASLAAAEAVLAEAADVDAPASDEAPSSVAANIAAEPGNLAWEAESAAAALELVQRALRASDLDEACRTVVAAVAEFLSARTVVVGISGSGGQCRVRAVSGAAELDPRASLTADLSAALTEIALGGRFVMAGKAFATSLPALAYRNTALLAEHASLLAGPLTVDGQETVGAWMVQVEQPATGQVAAGPGATGHERIERFMNAAAEPLAAALDRVQRSQPGPLARLLTPRLRRLNGRWAAAAAVGVALASAVPIRERVSCSCELQPTVRRFIAAPFEGIFATSLAQPGDRVRRGQVLARMDEREVRWELAGLTADEQRAGKSRDVNIVSSKVAAAQIDQLELARLDVKRKLLERRAAQLEIRSPIDGIILSGDLQRAQGARVTLGQPLFEVGPLDRMIAELSVADRDIGRVSLASDVGLWLDAARGGRRDARLAKIHPRSEVRDGGNVFVAEVVLDNPDDALRPGMKGSAEIYGPRRPAIYLLLRRPWQWLRGLLGW